MPKGVIIHKDDFIHYIIIKYQDNLRGQALFRWQKCK